MAMMSSGSHAICQPVAFAQRAKTSDMRSPAWMRKVILALTPEFESVLETSVVDVASGVAGVDVDDVAIGVATGVAVGVLDDEDGVRAAALTRPEAVSAGAVAFWVVRFDLDDELFEPEGGAYCSAGQSSMPAAERVAEVWPCGACVLYVEPSSMGQPSASTVARRGGGLGATGGADGGVSCVSEGGGAE